MNKLHFLPVAVSLGLLSGCNGFTRPLPPGNDYAGSQAIFSGLPAPMVFMGTATQWNDEYAVTAAHIPFTDNVVHRCSTGCDLVFIKRKAKGPVPQWREPVPGEEVVAVGYSGAMLVPVQGTGHAKSTRVLLEDKSSQVAYATHDAPLTVGMSGGPLYGADKAVLGINLGFGLDYQWYSDLDDPNSIGHSKRNSYYLSTDVIRAEWELFQRSLPQNQITQAH
ncbi:hypothetical protein SAMN05216421_1153 [Halopseudomonas xinjiangensis]|uniref:Trypsin-like peptidase domain-containing protein n=1 Tax=Halopseudomonas xinjiangensis TaxID=487184 RepID=A0A1H1QJF4_9GAMM|nr:trypsin-like peptidase domain-containing protein [Halopseudomonas xinjiangensis]SDS23631.1 hypothetical protein SAMN05216421_1153 [Halopseudomonas xinjiangensis]